MRASSADSSSSAERSVKSNSGVRPCGRGAASCSAAARGVRHYPSTVPVVGRAHAASASEGAPSASCNVPRLKYASALDGARASCGARGAGERAARGRQSGRHAHRSAVGAARFCVPAGSLQHHPVGVQPSRIGRAQPEPGVKGAHGRCEVSERLQHQAVLKPPIGKCRMEARGACVAARGVVEPALILKRVAKAHQLVGTSVSSIWALAVARARRSAHALAERVGRTSVAARAQRRERGGLNRCSSPSSETHSSPRGAGFPASCAGVLRIRGATPGLRACNRARGAARREARQR